MAVGVLFFLASCSENYQESKNERADRAAKSKAKDDIVIGLVWNEKDNKNELFFQGARLALEQINKRGGFHGRLIKTIEMHDLGSENRLGATTVARKMAANPNLIAVIGHSTSSSAIPASITYEHHGIVFISPSSTQIEFTNHNFQYVFRTIPNNKMQGHRLAYYAKEKGYKNIAVLYSSDANNEQVANIFLESSITEHEAKIVYKKMFFEKTKDFRAILSDILAIMDTESLALGRRVNVDAIFFAGMSEQGGTFIKQARRMGVEAPIIGSDGLDSSALWNYSEGHADGTVVPTVFFDNKYNPIQNNFKKAFKKIYKYKDEQKSKEKNKDKFKNPTTWAALAYDAVNLLFYAIETSNSTVPFEIAMTLRYLPKYWIGVTGCHRFLRTGDIIGKKMFIQKMVVGGSFKHIRDDGEAGQCQTNNSPM